MIARLKPFSLSFMCAILSAVTIIVIKLINGHLDSFILGLLRLVLTALAMLPIVIYKKLFNDLKPADMGWFLVMGLVGYCLNTTFYFLSLLHAPALNVALINVLIPILSLLACFLFFRDTPTDKELLAFALAFIGVILVVSDGALSWDALIDSYGEFLAFSSSICWVFYTMVLWHLKGRYSPYFIVFMGSVIGALCMMPIVWVQSDFHRAFHMINSFWPSLIYIGLFGTALLYIFYIKSVEIIGPSLTAFGTYSTRPLLVAFMAYFVLGASVSWWQVAGGLLVIGALYLVTCYKPSKTC